jgi:hypothetical protein
MQDAVAVRAHQCEVGELRGGGSALCQGHEVMTLDVSLPELPVRSAEFEAADLATQRPSISENLRLLLFHNLAITFSMTVQPSLC